MNANKKKGVLANVPVPGACLPTEGRMERGWECTLELALRTAFKTLYIYIYAFG